jgi:HEPN domain-containing protein
MRAETAEWVNKAEGDFRTAQREISAPDRPNYDAACFHAQQCVEKYLKARLVEADKTFPKVHDLTALLRLVLPLEPSWAFLEKGMDQLTSMAVEVRYPGITADIEDATEAVHLAAQVRDTIRHALKLE